MIIEVALGVVLGVVILRYWSEILALGVVAAVIAIVLAVGGAAIYWVATNEPLLRKVLTLLSLLAAFLVGAFVAQLVSKRTVLSLSEAGVFLTILLFLLIATAFFPAFIAKWSADAGDPQLFLFLLPIVGLWVWVWFKFSRLVRQRKHETPPTGTEVQLKR